MKTLFALLALYFLFNSGTPAQSRVVRLNAGLEAEVLSMGRSADHKNLTISMRISNKGRNTVFLLMVGSPIVTDNAGAVFDSVNFVTVSGITRCVQDINSCIGVPNFKEGYTVPLRAYTQIDPGIDIVVNMNLRTTSSKGPLISLSADLAYRLTADVLKDETLPDSERYKQVHMMTLSIPPMPVTDSR